MAIDDLLDEHEQSERVRDWLRRNGLGLIAGIALGLGLIAGWNWWQGQRLGQRVAAGDTYQAMQASLAAGNLKQAQAQAAKLDGNGIYATLAALDLAKAQLSAGQRDAAIASLRRVRAGDPALAQVVNHRLARLLIDAGKAQDALQMLAGADDPVSLEVRGDAHHALGRRDEARKAYAEALTKLDVAAPQRRLVEIKLTDVGGAPAQPESST